MRPYNETLRDRKPIVFLGSCLSLPNITESCQATGREMTGIIDDDYNGQTMLHGLPLLPNNLLDDSDFVNNHEFFVATGWHPGQQKTILRNNRKRQLYIDLMAQRGLTGATLVHPTAVISPLAMLGRNVRIGAMTMITARAEINDNVNVKEQCYISHDAIVGNDSIIQLKATITGHVHVGQKTYIGINAVIINRWSTFRTQPMIIGNNVLIHPGITVMQELPDNSVASLRDRSMSRIF